MTSPSRIYKRTAKAKESLQNYRASPLGQAAAKRGAMKQREQRAAVRAIVDARKATPCADCRQTFDPICMDFDHRPTERKLGKVSTMISAGVSMAVIEAEIAKCDLVCANCHRIRTFRKRDHGALVVRTYERVPAAAPQLSLPVEEPEHE